MGSTKSRAEKGGGEVKGGDDLFSWYIAYAMKALAGREHCRHADDIWAMIRVRANQLHGLSEFFFISSASFHGAQAEEHIGHCKDYRREEYVYH